MTDIVWLSAEAVIDIHAELIATFGGVDGLRDRGMLESALGRPEAKYHYGEADVAILAAAYAYGLARNHAFVDGNKRVAFAAIIVFLGLNGVDFLVPEADATAMILALAASEASEEALAAWIRGRLPS